MGWAGLKWITEVINGHVHYYDLGYRFIPEYWGQGYATEAAGVWMENAKDRLKVEKIYAITDQQNATSQNVLAKLGFITKQNFVYQGLDHLWFEKYLIGI